LVRGTPLIEDHEFVDCEIVGPAIVVPLDHVNINNVHFDAPPDALFYEVPPERTMVGVIGLRRVSIENCRMRQIGLMGTAESVAKLKQGLVR